MPSDQFGRDLEEDLGYDLSLLDEEGYLCEYPFEVEEDEGL